MPTTGGLATPAPLSWNSTLKPDRGMTVPSSFVVPLGPTANPGTDMGSSVTATEIHPSSELMM
jgi:hypothetical protein